MIRRNAASLTLWAICLLATVWLAPHSFAQEDQESDVYVPEPQPEVDTIMSPREACIENFGYMGCGPEGEPILQQRNGQRNSVVAAHWAAVAISKSLKAGASHGENSAAAADQTALANCRRNGPTDCKIVTRSSNRCLALAIAYNKGENGYGPGTDRKSAAIGAISRCHSVSGANCVVVVAPCPEDDPRWSAPLPLPTGVQGGTVDRRMVGTWQLLVNPGYWIWRVAPNGTYEFHSEAMDNARTNAGTITASNGNYSMHALNLRFDYTATYSFQGPDTMIVKGSLGTSTYHRMTANGR